MGLLDDLLGSVLGGGSRQQGGGQPQSAGFGGGTGGVMMALLPVVLSMLSNRGGGAQPGGGGGGLTDILGQVLGGGASSQSGGGLGGLLEQMQRTGFGDQARSWVGTGQNQPISPDALSQIFGQGGIEEIARRAGLTPQQASSGLSQLLPEVVDHVTPGGQEPDLDQLTRSVDNLRQRFGG